MIANLLLALLLVSSPAAVLETASIGDVPVTPTPGATIRGTATWYCGGGSPCTRGHSPSELIAAIDPSTGIPKGSSVTVTHAGRSVRVRIVDVCACAGARIIDLSTTAFKALSPDQSDEARAAFLGRGVIAVTINPARGSQDAPAMTLPPTDSIGGMP